MVRCRHRHHHRHRLWFLYSGEKGWGSCYSNNETLDSQTFRAGNAQMSCDRGQPLNDRMTAGQNVLMLRGYMWSIESDACRAFWQRIPNSETWMKHSAPQEWPAQTRLAFQPSVRCLGALCDQESRYWDHRCMYKSRENATEFNLYVSIWETQKLCCSLVRILAWK